MNDNHDKDEDVLMFSSTEVNDYIDHHQDIGCRAATDFLGYQTKCCACPFPKCVDELVSSERRQLKKYRNGGELPRKLMRLRCMAPYTDWRRDAVKV